MNRTRSTLASTLTVPPLRAARRAGVQTWCVVALHVAFLPAALLAQEASPRKSGSAKQVGVTLYANRMTLAPGESVKVSATTRVLSAKPLRFPRPPGGAALAHLNVKTPDGGMFVYWPYSSPRQAASSPRAKRFGGALRTGQGNAILTVTVAMTAPSPDWVAVATGKPACPDFRAVGEYQMWLAYHVPKSDGAPADAWHGHVQSPTIRLVVREIPLAKRRTQPTPEQLDDINVLIAHGKTRVQSERRLKRAIQRTENEGLARHIVGLLKPHQPRTVDGHYPAWWPRLYDLLASRAYASGTMRIAGPYRKDFGAMCMTVLEHRMAASVPRRARPVGTPEVDVDFLIAYSRTLKGGEKAAFEKRLGDLARRHAKPPPTGSDTRFHWLAHFKLSASWRILFGMGILGNGMALSEATEVLGKPRSRGAFVEWCYDSPMHVNPRLVGEVVQGAAGETVRFRGKLSAPAGEH